MNDLGFPHQFLMSDMNNDLVFGGLRDRLEDHRGAPRAAEGAARGVEKPA